VDITTESKPVRLTKAGVPRRKTGPKKIIDQLKAAKPELWLNEPFKAFRARAIQPQDIEAVAKLNAKRITIVEACTSLSIDPRVFNNYLDKNGNRAEFHELASRLRGAYLDQRLSEIEDAATNAQGKLKQPDWRASDRLLAIVAPERYSPQRQLTVTQAGKIQLGWLNTQSSQPEPAQVMDVESKLLPELPPEQ
jgi:hypothetical protein